MINRFFKFQTLAAIMICSVIAGYAQQNINFIAEPSQGCAPLNVKFTNLSSAGENFAWYFDDGSPVGTSASSSHNFITAGTYIVTLKAYTASGQLAGVYSDTVVVTAACSDFTISADTACSGQQIQFYTWSDAASYYWDFGDGAVTTESLAVEHSYTIPGNYNVTLIIYSNSGIDTVIKPVYINENMVPDVPEMFISNNAACSGSAVKFHTTSQALSIAWNFGDGSQSMGATVSHYYQIAGIYPVSLTVQNTCGNSTTTTANVTVSDTLTPPVPVFDAEHSTACPGEGIQFYTAANASEFLWDFGDGNTSDEKYITHTFSLAGVYPVTLTVTNLCGNTNSYTKDITIDGTLTPDEPFFTVDKTAACIGEVVSMNVNNGAVNGNWIFGDGEFYSGQNPSHSYVNSGTYLVQLVVSNTCGNANSHLETVYISDTLHPGLPEFFASSYTVCPGDPVEFYSYSNASAYNWNFGDGSDSNEPVATHVFATSGDYLVTLTVANYCGNTSAVTSTVHVVNSLSPQEPYFYVFPQSACPGQPVSFNTITDADSYYWDFGDGDTSALRYPSHSYTTAGAFEVKLTVTNSCGISSEYTDSVYIDGSLVPPVPYFIMNTDTACPGVPISFYTPVAALSYHWDFDDGNISDVQSATHSFSNAGIYAVSLTITNSCGNEQTFTDSVVIDAGLIPAEPYFTHIPEFACPGQMMQFITDVNADSYLWDFADNSTSTSQMPYHSFAAGGDYMVSLTVTNSCGNTNIYIHKISVLNAATPPVPEIYINPENSCTGQLINFQTWTNADSYLWNFGDGFTLGNQFASHSYSTGGNYTITLTITSSCGNSNSATTQIFVDSTIVPPQPVINYMPNAVCPGQQITFNCWDAAINYHWDFGDGAVSSAQLPEHTYDAGGFFEVVLSITNACGHSNADTLTVFIDTALVPDQPAMNISPVAACPGETISFTTAVNAPTYHWDYGDGENFDSQNSIHSYDTAGIYNVTLTVTNTCGNSNFSVAQVTIDTVYTPAEPYFSFYPETACPQTPISFYNSEQAHSYLWDFGDGTTSAAQNPVHSFSSGGTFTVSLTVFNACGNSASWSTTINIGAGMIPATPSFWFEPANACPGEIIHYYTYENAIEYTWNFGDGGGSHAQQPTHSYSSGNSYTVTLTVVNSCGLTNSSTQPVVVNNGLVPAAPVFSHSPENPCPGDVVYFSTDETADSYTWDFGDGTTSLLQNPLHIYTVTANYTVTLTITNHCGNSQSSSRTVVLNSNAIPEIPSFNASVYNACPNEQIFFDCLNTASSYLWDFGDGTTSTFHSPVHSYSSDESYFVTLSIFNSCGNSNSFTATIDINSHTIPNAPYFSHTPNNNICAGDDVQFSAWDTASFYHWDFGDGFTSSSSDPVHQYSATGYYLVLLTITNTCGLTASYSEVITIGTGNAPPAPSFSVSPASACAYETLEFTAITNAVSYFWNFGDGGTSDLGNTFHSYNESGNYTVSLTITNACGISSTASKTVYIGSGAIPPVPVFGSHPDGICPGDEIVFEIANPSGTYYSWDFGDGGGSSVITPAHVYSSPGTYLVTLTVYNCGNSNTYSDYVIVNNSAVPAFNFWTPNTVVCAGDPVTFFTDYNATGYSWDFGDGTVVTSTDSINNAYYANHTYAADGTYNVSLTVTNACGNSGTLSMAVQVTSSAGSVNGEFIMSEPQGLFYSANYVQCENISFMAWGGINYVWDFGDGQMAYGPNPVHFGWWPYGLNTISVTITSNCGASETYTKTVFIDGCESIDNPVTSSNNFSVFPNPANDKISVMFKASDKTHALITITDIFGRVIYSENAANENATANIFDIALPDNLFKPGIYFIRVTTGNEIYNAKIVKE